MDLMFGEDGTEYWPIVGGRVLPDDPAALFELGKFTHVPLLIGFNLDEGIVFTLNLPIKSSAGWRAFVTRRYGKAAGEFGDIMRVGSGYLNKQLDAFDEAFALLHLTKE